MCHIRSATVGSRPPRFSRSPGSDSHRSPVLQGHKSRSMSLQINQLDGPLARGRGLETLTSLQPVRQSHTRILLFSGQKYLRKDTATTSLHSVIVILTLVTPTPCPKSRWNAVGSTVARGCGRPSDSRNKCIWRTLPTQELDYLIRWGRER